MKGCIVLQGNFAKIGHALALELKKRHGVDEFCNYIFTNRAVKFVEKQTDIKYTNSLIDYEIQVKYKN